MVQSDACGSPGRSHRERGRGHRRSSHPVALAPTERIKWNFTEFLADKNGKVVKRYGSIDEPEKIEKAGRAGRAPLVYAQSVCK
jgi:hypothetical protein